MLEDLRKDGKITSTQKAYSKKKINDYLHQSGSINEVDHVEQLNQHMSFLHAELSNSEYKHLDSLVSIRNTNYKNKDQIERKIFLAPVLLPELDF